MTDQLDLFEAQKRRDDGIARVSQWNQTFLDAARSVARKMIRDHGHVTADQLRARCEDLGVTPGHPNAWGAVFKSEEFTGLGYTKSTRPSAHARVVRVWGLK